MNSSSVDFDVIVVGAGHAGIEAALAVGRMGGRALLLTFNLDQIAHMSCNRAIDATGIQFRRLNTKKGPAVQASRAQADKALYRLYMKNRMETAAGVHLRQASAHRLLVESGRVAGLENAVIMRPGYAIEYDYVDRG